MMAVSPKRNFTVLKAKYCILHRCPISKIVAKDWILWPSGPIPKHIPSGEIAEWLNLNLHDDHKDGLYQEVEGKTYCQPEEDPQDIGDKQDGWNVDREGSHRLFLADYQKLRDHSKWREDSHG